MYLFREMVVCGVSLKTNNKLEFCWRFCSIYLQSNEHFFSNKPGHGNANQQSPRNTTLFVLRLTVSSNVWNIR